ncbi:MAG: histidinol-phosphate transaminase [Clostridium sp.]|uniref:histidinol-phosphate transaminase n=1 Tax=Clostridium sp. TaxID=1506 RepID=UPI002911846F|nr:histidinol-phosphate transaminase [Clostridium sp.]MDU7337436.1 histidinol-phosphate transaminase [Clostridium sp.]
MRILYQLNSKIKDLKPYEPLKGDFRIRLDANESFLPLPTNVMTKMLETLVQTDFNRYPDPLAVNPSRAFSEYYGIDPELVTAGNGSDELISVLISTFLMKGDTVVTLSPDFTMYRFYSSLVEVQCVEVVKNSDLTIDVNELITVVIQTGAKMILFSNPCNPTSLGLTREEVRKIINSVNALVVLDEAYMDFWDQSLLEEVEQYDNLVILRTCSKAFGLAALRIGFAVANPTITSAIRAVKSPYNVNTLTQSAASVILSNSDILKEASNQIVCSRILLSQQLENLLKRKPNRFDLFPSCTNFVFLRLSDAKSIYEQLLFKGIAVRLMGDCLRITAGAPQENTELITALEQIL